MITRSFNKIDLDLAVVEAEIAGVVISTDTIRSVSTNTDLTLSGNGTGKVTLNDRTKVNGELSVAGDVYFNNSALISDDTAGEFSNRSGSNIDHIWHDDTTGTWNFCSDTTYKAPGNSTLAFASLQLSADATASVLKSTVAQGTAPLQVTSTTKVDNLNADLLDGLTIHTGTNNEANKIVRTDNNGYVDFGWINTISGDTTTVSSDYYVNTNDGYIRKKTLANVKAELIVASEILAKIKTVDGSGSGLDADLLDGLTIHTGTNNEANKIVRTDNNGYVDFGWINTISGDTTTVSSDYYVNTNDGYIRKKTLANVKAELIVASEILAKIKTVDGSGSGLDADTLDGYNLLGGSGSDQKNGIPLIKSDGVMDISKYIDFHTINSTNDYDARLDCTSQGALRLEGAFTASGNVTANTFTGYLNIMLRNEMNIAEGFNNSNGIVYLNYRGASKAITEVRIMNGIASNTYASVSALSYNATSDERKKKDIEVIENATEIISEIDGVFYNWKDENLNTDRQAGVIAQTVEKVFPEAVKTNDEDTKTVNYNALVGLLIESNKEQQKTIVSLTKRIADLESCK